MLVKKNNYYVMTAECILKDMVNYPLLSIQGNHLLLVLEGLHLNRLRYIAYILYFMARWQTRAMILCSHIG